MLTKFKMDYDLSKNIYEECSDLVMMKQCYRNIASTLTKHILYEEDLCNIKVAFGAWSVSIGEEQNVYARHCFFLLEDKVIDPTFFTLLNEQNNKTYLVFKTFDIDEYLTALTDCNGDTYLYKYTEQMYRDVLLELMNQNIILIG